MNTLRHIFDNKKPHNFRRLVMHKAFRRTLVAGVFASSLVGSLLAASSPVFSVASCHKGKNMNIVAHQDDDILFLSPDLLDSIDEGDCVRTVYVTAGNDGRNASYWTKREDGAKAAYAMMAGSDNEWTNSSVQTSVGSLSLSVLKDDPRISLMFMRLPDGDHNGSGFKLNDHASLQKLWDGTIPSIKAVDQSGSYTKDDLVAVLTDLIRTYAPDTVNTQDYAGEYGDGDHSDHHTVAYATKMAQDSYDRPHNFVGYEDYTTAKKPANLSSEAFLRKQEAFFAYATYDPHVCDTEAVCSHLGYGAWLPRQYTLPFTIKGASLKGMAIELTNHVKPAQLYATLQGGGVTIAKSMSTRVASINLPPQTTSPVAKQANKQVDKTPKAQQFHLPFVGLDVPQLTDSRTKENLDIYVPQQPIVVMRGWISDNELSEATTSTV